MDGWTRRAFVGSLAACPLAGRAFAQAPGPPDSIHPPDRGIPMPKAELSGEHAQLLTAQFVNYWCDTMRNSDLYADTTAWPEALSRRVCVLTGMGILRGDMTRGQGEWAGAFQKVSGLKSGLRSRWEISNGARMLDPQPQLAGREREFLADALSSVDGPYRYVLHNMRLSEGKHDRLERAAKRISNDAQRQADYALVQSVSETEAQIVWSWDWQTVLIRGVHEDGAWRIDHHPTDGTRKPPEPRKPPPYRP